MPAKTILVNDRQNYIVCFVVFISFVRFVTWKTITAIGIQPQMHKYFIQISSFSEQLFKFLAPRLLYVVLDSTLGFHLVLFYFEANYLGFFFIICFKKLEEFRFKKLEKIRIHWFFFHKRYCQTDLDKILLMYFLSLYMYIHMLNACF